MMLDYFCLNISPQIECLKQHSFNDISQFHGSPGTQLVVPLLSFLVFVTYLQSDGAGPSMLLYVASVSTGHLVLWILPVWLLSLSWTLYMLSLVQEVEVIRLPLCLSPSLRTLLPPHSRSWSSHRPNPDPRGRTQVPSLEGQAEMLGQSHVSYTPSSRALCWQLPGDGKLCLSLFWMTHRWCVEVGWPPHRASSQWTSLVCRP